MLPSSDRNAGCSTSAGGCKTCPNAPKSPSDWFYRLGYATQTLLKLILGYCVVLTILELVFPQVFRQSVSLESLFGAPPAPSTWTLSLVRTLVSAILFLPKQFLDYTPLISLSFLFDMYLLATFMSRAELDVFGGYVLDIFEFPGKDLFSVTQLQSMNDEHTRKGNVFVRSLRTMWFYVFICVALWATFWVVCAPAFSVLYLLGLSMPVKIAGSGFFAFSSAMMEVARPTHSVVTTICAVWCFLEPKDRRLKLPFSDLFASNKKKLSPAGDDRQQRADTAPPAAMPSEARTNATYDTFIKSKNSVALHGVKATSYPYVLVGIHWLMSGGSILVLVRELVSVRLVAHYYARLLSDRSSREQNAVPTILGRWFDRSVQFLNVTIGRGLQQIFWPNRTTPLRLVPQSAHSFVKSNLLTIVPKTSFDIPRSLSRWIKKRTTTERLDQLKQQGALTPWAKNI